MFKTHLPSLKSPTKSKTSVPLTLPRPKPPEVNKLDHQTCFQNGPTSVLQLSPQGAKYGKLNPSLNLCTRVEELTRELGHLYQRIQFYRQCFEILQRLRETAYDVYQQLIIAHYLDHDSNRLDELITQLHHGLEDSVRREAKAERAWMEFWGINHSEKEIRGESRSKPPEVNKLDHQIRLQNGSTSVLQLSPHRVQHGKLNPSLNLSARVEELMRELVHLRQEIQFYEQCFEILQRLREIAYDIYQQLFLAHYLDHDSNRLDELITQLHHGLEDSVQREAKAEKAWMEFWGINYNEKEVEGELI
jgi:hypothetical protein